jgi:membrane protease subunit HflC
MTMKIKGVWMVLLIAAAVVLYESTFVVTETEQVVITQFGKIVRDPIREPGLNFKIPFIEKTNFFPKNIMEWDGEPGQIPTLDKTFIWVDAFARWRIVDPVKFFQTVNNRSNAMSRLNDIIDPAVRNFITSHKLIDAVRKSNRELDTAEVGLEDLEKKPQSHYGITIGREKITQGILEQAQPKVDQFGIELVDVKIKGINYVEEVRKSVYDRMIAERKQIAEKFRSEGKGEAQKVLGQKDKELQQITSEAYRVAQEVRGKADAEAAKIYADAYGVDPDFYAFTQTLEAYNESLGKDASLLLTTDSEFMKYFKGLSGKTR